MGEVQEPVEGEYGVIEERNTITGKIQWSVGKWIHKLERKSSIAGGSWLLPVKDDSLYLASVGARYKRKREEIDLEGKGLIQSRLTFKTWADANSTSSAMNQQDIQEKIERAWVYENCYEETEI